MSQIGWWMFLICTLFLCPRAPISTQAHRSIDGYLVPLPHSMHFSSGWISLPLQLGVILAATLRGHCHLAGSSISIQGMRPHSLAFFGNWATQAQTSTSSTGTSCSTLATPPPSKLVDKGPSLPKLYGGWFDNTLINQASAAINAAVRDGVKTSEVLFPSLPNMEEREFGTELNMKYNKAVAARLKGPDNILRRKSVAYANVDIASRVAGKTGKRTLILTYDGAVDPNIIKISSKAMLTRINALDVEAATRANDIIFALSPGTGPQWSKASGLKTDAPVVAINAPFSLNYDIAQGGKWEPIYVVKRVTKGWVFRAYPHEFKVYLDKPDGSVELIKEFKGGVVPKLREVSSIVREESQRRGYAVLNDRYLTQRL